jgi:hypothetical protein
MCFSHNPYRVPLVIVPNRPGQLSGVAQSTAWNCRIQRIEISFPHQQCCCSPSHSHSRVSEVRMRAQFVAMRQFPVQHREILLSCPTAPRHKKALNTKRRFALITATLLCVQSPSRVDTSCGLGIDTPCRVFAPDCSSARLALLTHAQAEAAEEPKITGSQRAGHGFPHSIVPSALNRDGVMHEQ